MSIEYLVTIGIIFISVLLVIVFLSPGERKKRVKKDISQPDSSDIQQDLQQQIARLEKKIQHHKDTIVELQKNEKNNEKLLMVERVKVKKLQEKLSQERQWHTKEQDSIDKRGKEVQQLKRELLSVQESFSKEHAANIRLEHKVRELEEQNKALNEMRRSIERENAEFKAKMENNRREISDLKRENKQLIKKKEDVNWIAKEEYERVEKLLKEKEKQLERMNRKETK